MILWRRKGFTALELVVTMAVIAVLLAAGVPAFKNYSWNLRMKSAMDMLLSDLNLARGRAISHNTQTVICPADDDDDCSGQSAWQNGWIVFADLNGDHGKQDGEPLIRRTDAVAFLDISSAVSRSYLRFYPNGSAPGSNATILFCDARGANHAGVITLSNSGRVRVRTNAGEPSEICP
ncbi:MAG: GspH/FimT family pseudopilin [Lysobacterales bacterium]